MYEKTQDAMTYVKTSVRPDLFITFTCNPKWTETSEALLSGQAANHRHDIVAHVFRQKVVKLMGILTKSAGIFGVVGYKYTRTISSKIFNKTSVVKQLDLDNGTKDMECSCSSSEFCYGPAGHVVSRDLRIIKDAKLRELVNKGPSYRKQNNIDWGLNARICKEAVTK